MSPRPPTAQPGGFTLIEVLVAIVILAISLTVIMQLFAGGFRLKGDAQHYDQVLRFAQFKMEELLLRDPNNAAPLEGGNPEAYRWEAQITEIEEVDDAQPDIERPLQKYEIRLSVFWNEETQPKRLDLHTMAIQGAGESDFESAQK